LKGQRWRVRLSEPARADIREIFRWTADRFGEAQANAYGDIILAALDALRRGPKIVGVRARPDIARGLYTLHVSRNRRRGRHIVLFRLGQDSGQLIIVVGRILHDSMDIARHLPSDIAEEEE
jgi:toxin ParE1/3/4